MPSSLSDREGALKDFSFSSTKVKTTLHVEESDERNLGNEMTIRRESNQTITSHM
jgi:hypothetical protein